MKTFRIPVISLICLIIYSCHSTNIIRKTPVELIQADSSLAFVTDTTLIDAFAEVMNCIDLCFIDDTTLILREASQNEEGFRFFKRYSCRSLSYMGEGVTKGRGPGEMLYPYVTGSIFHKGCNASYLYDSSLSKAYLVDLMQIGDSRTVEVIRSFQLPPDVMYAHPLSDTSQFIVHIESDEIICSEMDFNGMLLNRFNLFRNIPASQYLSQLSFCITINPESSEVAMFMLGLPQINILNTQNGMIRSYAVDKSFRNWNKTIRTYDLDTMLYYDSAVSTSEYIFALYRNISLGDRIRNIGNSHIHIFDWNGNFLYDIRVSENIGAMAFDRINRHLYCADESDCSIIRYDLSQLLAHSDDAGTPR